MQTGLQMIDKKFYYFDNDGYMKTGKIANVEEEDDNYTYYFETKNGKNGQGYTGEKSVTFTGMARDWKQMMITESML